MANTARLTLVLVSVMFGVLVLEASGDRREIAESDQETLRRQLTGTWQDEYQGKRTMTLRPDGTGTMLVELSGLQAALFARELRFDMVWELEGRQLKKRTVGGEPAGKVSLVLKMKGNTATDTILESSATRLLLLDENGETEYDWERVPEDADLRE